MEKYGRAGQATDDGIIRRTFCACRIPKATDTHSYYLVLTAFPCQQWFRERSSVLRLHVHCLSCILRNRWMCCRISPSGIWRPMYW